MSEIRSIEQRLSKDEWTPCTERVKAITDMMYELGMYTQAKEIDLLAAERDMALKAFYELKEAVDRA